MEWADDARRARRPSVQSAQKPRHWSLSQCRSRAANGHQQCLVPDQTFPYKFVDAAYTLPTLVRSLCNPPQASCPVAHAAPDGAYLLSVIAIFNNMWLQIRV